jgi:hypothetical protein
VDITSPYLKRDTRCNTFFSSIDFSRAEFAIVVARWNFYMVKPDSGAFYRAFDFVSEDPRENIPASDLIRRGLVALVVKARQAGVRRILLIGPIPEFPFDSRYCVGRAIRLNTSCMIRRSDVDTRRAPAMEMLHDVASRFEDARVLDPIEVFCSTSTCSPHLGRTLFYFDSNHMSPAGADRFLRAFRSDFEWAFGGMAAIAKGPTGE